MDARTDGELLSALRAGDNRAYEVLWHRHAPAAHRYARRLMPSRAEDLVSESFLAIYQQVTTGSAGPQFAFRSYLKAVLRNTAIRWRKDVEQFVDADAEPTDERDALSIAEQDSEATDVLAALQALPERWQRVLWLAEVVEAGRPQIAQELQIRPNAVSALQRRARTGLKFQWLTRQIPLDLRDDPTHVARLFPQFLTEVGSGTLAAEVTHHIADCRDCADLLFGLRGAASRLQGSTLAVLLGSAGVGTATATLSSGTTATAVVVAGAGAGVIAWLSAGGIAAVTAGGLFISSLVAVDSAAGEPGHPTSTVAAEPARVPAPTPSPPPGPVVDASAPAAPDVPSGADLPTGRGITDPTIEDAGFDGDPATQATVLPPDRPPAAGPGVPDPASSPDPGTTPDPGAAPTPSPGVTTPTSSPAYLSPVLAGRTTPGDGVALQLDGQRYTPAVADDGTWVFDTRGLELAAGDYTYQAWAYSATAQSAVTEGAFTVLPLEVHGFEDLTGFEDMTVAEAATTGVVITIQGPANGQVFLSSMEGHTAIVALDATGFTRKRLVMNSRGWYYITFRALDADGYWGPGVEDAVDVYDPDVIMDPWGPSPEDMTFDLVDP